MYCALTSGLDALWSNSPNSGQVSKKLPEETYLAPLPSTLKQVHCLGMGYN